MRDALKSAHMFWASFRGTLKVPIVTDAGLTCVGTRVCGAPQILLDQLIVSCALTFSSSQRWSLSAPVSPLYFPRMWQPAAAASRRGVLLLLSTRLR